MPNDKEVIIIHLFKMDDLSFELMPLLQICLKLNKLRIQELDFRHTKSLDIINLIRFTLDMLIYANEMIPSHLLVDYPDFGKREV